MFVAGNTDFTRFARPGLSEPSRANLQDGRVGQRRCAGSTSSRVWARVPNRAIRSLAPLFRRPVPCPSRHRTAAQQRQPRHPVAAHPAVAFYFLRQDSGNSCRGSKNPISFSMLWQCAYRRPIPGLRVGSGRMQTADHDCPFMTLSSEFGAVPAFHLTQVLHRSIAQLTNYGDPSRPARWRSGRPCR